MNEDVINIRDIQHFFYCRHRWGLLNIGSTWAENYYVTKANLLHNRVHDSNNAYTARGKCTFTSVSVYNDQEQYNIYGVLDCLELVRSIDGTYVEGLNGKYKFTIVEYKPTQPKGKPYNEDDLMQVFAQKLCVDYIFGSDCDVCIYYANTKKRVPLLLRENWEIYDSQLRANLLEMRRLRVEGIIPVKEQGQKCSGCSLKNICIPINRKRRYSHRKCIQESIDA